MAGIMKGLLWHLVYHPFYFARHTVHLLRNGYQIHLYPDGFMLGSKGCAEEAYPMGPLLRPHDDEPHCPAHCLMTH